MALKFNLMSIDESAPGGTAADVQPATTTLVKNTVTVKGLMESCEAELGGIQDVVADMREIVRSIDNVLQKLEAIE